MTRERPITLSAWEVRAILEWRKTQLRRAMAETPPDFTPGPLRHPAKHTGPYFDAYCGEDKTAENPRGMSEYWRWWSADDRPAPETQIECPFGYPGVTLWVRETWGLLDTEPSDGPDRAELFYRATDEHSCTRGRWRPSTNMPRRASRLTLRITDVRVQRLQDISEEDAIAEGAKRLDSIPDVSRYGNGSRWSMFDEVPNTDYCLGTARLAFGNAWNKINGKSATWSSNPWVWAISFEVIK